MGWYLKTEHCHNIQYTFQNSVHNDCVNFQWTLHNWDLRFSGQSTLTLQYSRLSTLWKKVLTRLHCITVSSNPSSYRRHSPVDATLHSQLYVYCAKQSVVFREINKAMYLLADMLWMFREEK